MFVYCLNNPVVFADNTGMCCYIAPISYWYDCDDWRCSTSSAKSPLEEAMDQIQTAQATQAQLQFEVTMKQIEMANSFVKSEDFEILTAGGKIASGGKDVVVGVLLVLDPVPAPGEEAAGVYKFAFGIVKFFRGIAELIGELTDNEK